MGLRQNKLLRAKLQVQAKNKYSAGDNQPTPDEQLTRLEDDIRRLRVEFDIFFNGAAKRPVGHRKTCGFNDMRFDPEAGAESQNRTGILRDIGLVEGDPHAAMELVGGPEPPSC